MEKKAIILAIAMLTFIAWISFLLNPESIGQPYNESVLLNTTVNITNAAPGVSNVILQNPIDLTAGTNTSVQCNFTVQDYDNNTIGANATLYFSDNLPTDPQDQNYLYVNTSCTNTSIFGYETNFSCIFDVNYFANNGTWFCNATGIDDENATGSNVSAGSVLNPLVAISVPGILDFGNLAFGEVSNDTEANVTNYGNRNASVEVEGYGATPGDDKAMICDFGNIPIGFERYDNVNGSLYALMTSLTGSPVSISGYQSTHRTNEVNESINQVFWKISIPAGAGGVCNGFVLFTASDNGT